jgi:two-component system response regulator FixJ
MPGMDGLTLLETLGSDRKGIPVVVLTGHADVPMAVRAIRAGAADFVEKPFAAARLLDSIRSAIARSAPVAGTADTALRSRFAELTPREREVMEQMVIGLPNKLIAHRLGMSPRTVEIHRGRVMAKTGADSLSHLVRMAIRAGLDPDG